MGMGWSRWTRTQARLGALLTVCAIAVRVFIPAGFMVAPTPNDSGLPAIIICTAQGAKAVSVQTGVAADDHGPSAPTEGNKTPDHGCVFAGAVTPLPAPSLTLARAERLADPVTVDRPVSHQRPGLGLAAPPPFKTGPPTVV